MSTGLTPLDLTAKPVGFQGTINFNQFPKFDPSNFSSAANLWLFNESGAGLNIVFQQSNNSHYLPAGAWGFFALAQNDSQVQVTITYLLPNPPVSQLNAVYYAPGEPLPQSFTLGNSPIGIGGTVNTSGVQTLSNEGGAPTPLLVIDIGNTSVPNLINIYNDGTFNWSISGHTLMQGTLANLLQLGKLGDITQVLGQLSVAQLLTAVNGISVTAGGLVINAGGLGVNGGATIDSLGVTGNETVGGTLGVTGNETVGGTLGVTGAATIGGNLLFSNGQFGVSGAGDVIAANGSDSYFRARGASNALHFQDSNHSDFASMDSSGVHTGTINLTSGSITNIAYGYHAGQTGTNINVGFHPNYLFITPVIAQPGSATAGGSIAGAPATTFSAYVAAGTGFWWLALS